MRDRRRTEPKRFPFYVISWTLAMVAAAADAQEEPGKTPQPPAAQRLLNGKDLAGWRIVDQFDFAKHGRVAWQQDVLVLEQGVPATGISWKQAFPRTSYEVSLDAQRREGSDFFCGMTFPVGPQYCTLIVGGWGGGVTGLSKVNGFSADENETTTYQDFKNNQWYHIRLRVTPDRIQAWIDRQQVVNLEVKDKKFSIWWEQEPVRPFGIANWYTTSGLKNVRLTRLLDARTQDRSE